MHVIIQRATIIHDHAKDHDWQNDINILTVDIQNWGNSIQLS